MKALSRTAPLLLLLLVACASSPETPPTAAAPQEEQKFRTVSEAEAVAKDDDLICRTERKTGTRIDTQRCATRAEWQRLREASTEDYRRAATRGLPIKPGG
jgi:outer membrane biogenesis lipoprotein LolB